MTCSYDTIMVSASASVRYSGSRFPAQHAPARGKSVSQALMRLLILRSHYPPRRKICDVKVCQSKRIRDHSVARVNCRDARKRTRNHSRCLAIRVGPRPDKTIVASSTCAKITATLINGGSAAQNHSLLQTFGRVPCVCYSCGRLTVFVRSLTQHSTYELCWQTP